MQTILRVLNNHICCVSKNKTVRMFNKKEINKFIDKPISCYKMIEQEIKKFTKKGLLYMHKRKNERKNVRKRKYDPGPRTSKCLPVPNHTDLEPASFTLMTRKYNRRYTCIYIYSN